MDYNFVDVMKTFDRMCNKYDSICDINECPVARLIDTWEKQNDATWDRDCAYFGSKYPEDFMRVVMQWRSTHPEPLFPSVGEIISKIRELMNVNESEYDFEDFLGMRLTEAAANYFGIKPINEDKLV